MAAYGNLFNQVTDENVGKWGLAEPSKDAYLWGHLDAMYAAADSFNLITKLHAFVWGRQQPDWVNNSNAKEAVEDWIRDYMKRYGTKVDMIDVVNEPLHDQPSYKEGLGGDGETGWDWVIWVYEKARQYAPDAQLLVNEYDVLNHDNVLTSYLTIITLPLHTFSPGIYLLDIQSAGSTAVRQQFILF